MQYLYRPNECQMTFQEAGARQVYGIDCYRRDRKDAPPVAQYRDVSIDRGEMDRLADRCNRGQLDPLQLEVVILDAILDIEHRAQETRPGRRTSTRQPDLEK